MISIICYTLLTMREKDGDMLIFTGVMELLLILLAALGV